MPEPRVIPGLVSTIIPVFNRPEMLRRAVDSVLAQTYRPIEVLLVDDGSTDETPHVCAEYARRYPDIVKVIRKKNEGRAGLAREAGRQAASGEFLQYLDSDDILLPAKFSVMVDALTRHPECGIAYCFTRRYRDGETPRDVPCRRTGETFARMFPPILRERIWQTVTPLYRREVCDRAGAWSDLMYEEDWEYEARIAAQNTPLYHCKQFLADMIDHDSERLSGRPDPRRVVGERSRALGRIYRCAADFGILPDDPNMRFFARHLFFIARECGAMGMETESRELFHLAVEASGPHVAWDIRLYGCLARAIGWVRAGRVTHGEVRAHQHQEYRITVTDYFGYEKEVLRIRNANRKTMRTLDQQAWRYQTPRNAPAPKVFWVRDQNGEAVGMASVIYRYYWVDGKLDLFGVLGDVSLDVRLRGRGIGKRLIAEVNHFLDAEGLGRRGFVIPNVIGAKTTASAGWHTEGRVLLHVLPVCWRAKICKMLRCAGIAQVKPGAPSARLLRRLNHHVTPGDSFEFNDWSDEEIDAIWRVYPKNSQVIADRCAASLRWRYTEHPVERFLIGMLRRGGDAIGYAVVKFSEDRQTCEIYDVLATPSCRIESVVAALVLRCIKSNPLTEVRIVLSEEHPGQKKLWKLGFIRRAAVGHFLSYVPLDSKNSKGSEARQRLEWVVAAGDKDA